MTPDRHTGPCYVSTVKVGQIIDEKRPPPKKNKNVKNVKKDNKKTFVNVE